ncbi:MAG: excinuclease ATPase subunit [Pseudomonadota bacterium]
MKKTMLMVVLAALAAGSSVTAQAADRKVNLSIAAAMAANDGKEKLGDSVQYFFAGQPTPKVIEKLGTDKTSQKTNAFGKSDEKACNWVFLSAMMRLEKRAKELGANAVVNIVSNYGNNEWASATEFECHAGAIMAGVALKGDFVRIADGKK